MKAVAVFPKAGRLGIIDQPEPQLADPADVKVRMLEVGICGTDKEIASFQYGAPPPGSDALVLGHESLGQVVEVGPQVKSLRPGDLCVIMVRRPCPRPGCIACRSGRPDFCYTGDYTERGIKGASGYMTELVVDREQYMVQVPAELRDIAVLTEPLTIAEKAIEQVLQIQQRLPWGCPDGSGRPAAYRHKAVVIGAGPVGLLGAMALSVKGFELNVYSLEPPGDRKARLVEAIGGLYTSSKQVPIDQFPQQVGNIDLVYEATGAAQISFDLLKYLGVNGLFVFTGVPGRRGPFEFDGAQVMRKMVLDNQLLLGTVNAPREAYVAAVHDLAAFRQRWGDQVNALVTGKYPMDRYADLLTGKVEGIKRVMVINSEAK